MRYLGHILLAVAVLVGAGGCRSGGAPEVPIWETTKIWELAPAVPEGSQAEFLVAARFNVHVFDVPADNVDQLEDLWRLLSAEPIRTNSYTAFARNFFRVRFGRADLWGRLLAALAEAGAQRGGTVSIDVPSDAPMDLPIAELPRGGAISYATTTLSWQQAQAQPGRLVLRLRAETIPGARGARKIIGYPVATPGLASAIPELQARVREGEVYFASAAFAADIGPGDLLVLGPNEYTAERLTLGGLFFNEPQDVLFLDPETTAPPQRLPAVRVFILVCTGMID